MFLKLFRKKQSFKKKDFVWINQSAKRTGFTELLRSHPNAIVTAWFPKTISEYADLMPAGNTVRNARHLAASTMEGRPLIFLEHYPIGKKEEEITEHWKPSVMYFLNALDEPIFVYFGGERITSLMQTLGIAENEVIEHRLITASLKNAQEKIAAKVINEHSATSQQEWFDHNLPRTNNR